MYSFKKLVIALITISMNNCFIHSAPTASIFIEQKELDFDTFLRLEKTEACNINGCFFPKNFYFVREPLIICPKNSGIKLAYKDQKGSFRFGSLSHDKNKIISNCKYNFSSTTTPNYMRPTLSSDAKRRQTSTPLPEVPIFNLDTSSILTDDLSKITQCSFEDSIYLRNSVPQNLLDDRGDAIYASSLMSLLISLFGIIVKLIYTMNEKKRLEESVYPKSSTFISNNASETSKSMQYQTAMQNSTCIEARHQFPVPSSDKCFCNCKKSNCISGNCSCHRANRACGPACHGGNANKNCKATL